MDYRELDYKEDNGHLEEVHKKEYGKAPRYVFYILILYVLAIILVFAIPGVFTMVVLLITGVSLVTAFARYAYWRGHRSRLYVIGGTYKEAVYDDGTWRFMAVTNGGERVALPNDPELLLLNPGDGVLIYRYNNRYGVWRL